MSIPPIGAPTIAATPPLPERLEKSGPDHDGDADDKGVSTTPSQQQPARGTGIVVDKTA